MDNLLYYPYINVPQSDWTARALLYYDHVGSIVPGEYFYEPDKYDSFMRELVQSELIVPIDPMQVFNNPNQVFRPFIDYINSRSFKVRARRDSFGKEKLYSNQSRMFGFQPQKIHQSKFDYEIFYQLEQAGLAEQQGNGWYLIETKTANELMTFLASVIGERLEYLPTTDIYNSTLFALNRSKKDIPTIRSTQKKREFVLKELIPFPQEIDLKQLRIFKETHSDLLKSFRNKVELIAFNPNIKEDSPHFIESIKELKFRKEELSARMTESKFKHIFYGGICATISSTIYLATANTNPGTVAATLGLVGAIYSAVKIINPERLLDHSGVKYLALIDRKFRNRPINRRYPFF